MNASVIRAHGVRVYCGSQCVYKHAFWFLTDFDECDLELDNCHEDALCINTRTHFECDCKDGFLGDGINCTGQDNFFKGLTFSALYESG